MILRFFLPTLFLMGLFTPLVCRADEQSQRWEVVSGVGQDFHRDRFIELTHPPAPANPQLRLAPTYLVSNAMARSSKVVDELSEEESSKVVFSLGSIPESVRVLIYNGWGKYLPPRKIEINGHPYLHERDEAKMLTGGWDRFVIPREFLVEGRNEVVFQGPGTLWLDEDSPGGNSFKRLSPQSEWRTDCLGPEDRGTGEYIVRFRIKGHPPEGSILSPVIDLSQGVTSGETVSSNQACVAPLLALEEIEVSFNDETPETTAVRYDFRSGSTPEWSPSSWTPWRPAAKGAPLPLPQGRFIQWRATLQTERCELSPSIQEARFEVTGKKLGANFEKIRLTQPPDNDVKTSSYDFTYADPHHPRMRHLREKYHLEEIAAAGKTDAEKFLLVSQWIREQWEGWDMGKYDYCPQWDALEILELAPAKLALGMCTHYAATFVQAAASLGYPARSVIVDHHCLAEAWSDHYGKWMFVDTGLLAKNPIALKYVDNNGIPLNALDLHERYLKNDASDVTVVPDPSLSMKEFWKRYLNLYCRFAIPLRNDHLYNPMPQELEHGHTQYHWDGYLWWTDDLDPKYPEYSLLTNRPEDFYWTLNKTVIDLEDTLEKGRIKVFLHGPIPNLKEFQVRKNDADWERTRASFVWDLKPGVNHLEARAVNTMDLELPINELVLNYTP